MVPDTRAPGQAGYSLLELLIVVAILGIVALAAIPSLSSSDSATIDLAANEVAQALRFARSEAVRTGQDHGVYANVSDQRVRVYKLASILGVPVPDYSVRHPVDKKLFEFDFAIEPTLEDVRIASVSFQYSGLGSSPDYIGFTRDGTPKYENSGSVYLLASALIRIVYRGLQRDISVSPVTGRVTVQ